MSSVKMVHPAARWLQVLNAKLKTDVIGFFYQLLAVTTKVRHRHHLKLRCCRRGGVKSEGRSAVSMRVDVARWALESGAMDVLWKCTEQISGGCFCFCFAAPCSITLLNIWRSIIIFCCCCQYCSFCFFRGTWEQFRAHSRKPTLCGEK